MPRQPPVDLTAEQWRIVREILLRLVPDREVWAFGSRAKDTAKEYSDLDLAVVGDDMMSLALIAEMREAFQESALPFKVDIVDWASADDGFREIVAKNRVLLQAGKSAV